MLSPENYIRTKARSLPIYECLVNSDWEESKTVLLIIARKHNTGNITACYYMVDLMCLGVKDTNYMFNISHSDYQSKAAEMYEELELEKIDYTLAHNIVYASLEYADEFGFKPHKDFTSVTRFMLEEDTDEVEMIEIECGHNGIPLYLRGPYDNDARANQIVNQLKKTAGPGKYIYIEHEEDFPEDDFDQIDDDTLVQESEEKKNDFLNLYPRFDKLKAGELLQLTDATNFIFEELTDPNSYDEYYDFFAGLLEVEFDDGPLPVEIFGLEPGDEFLADSLEDSFYEILYLAEKKPKKARKLWELYKVQTGDIASVYYLELMLLIEKEPEVFAEKLTKYYQRFPKFPLIKLLFFSNKLRSDCEDVVIQDNFYSFDYFYPKRTNIHLLEIFNYMVFLLTLVLNQNKPSQLDAFYDILNEMEEIPEKQMSILIMAIMLAKMEAVAEYLNVDYK